MKKFVALILCLATLAPATASAWWNPDWSQRRKIVVNTTSAGADIKESLSLITVPVRLHTGNFIFSDAKPDGSDLRFVAVDDKTPLKHFVETFDAVNELAVVWVQVPKVAGSSASEHFWLYYGNQKVAAADDPKGSYDGSHVAVFNFGEGDAKFVDASANGVRLAVNDASVEPGGLLGQSASFDGRGFVIEQSPAMALSAQNGLTVSAWLRPAGPQAGALIYSVNQGAQTVQFGIAGTRLTARILGVELVGGDLRPAAWQHVALTVGGGKARIYLDGREVASGNATLAEVLGEVAVGTSYQGQIDALQIARVARSDDWVKAAVAAQGVESSLLVLSDETESAESGGHSYFGILVGSLTTDAWVVIIILMGMFAVSMVVMAAKARFVNRMAKSNEAFLESFREIDSVLVVADSSDFAHSSLYRLYQAGTGELKKRMHRASSIDEFNISPQSIDAIKASVDANLVRETQRLNSKMVLLTIAISGGPFLGLLGTVVGVMITFAAIAAAGDVNVNSIAPGIAAALLATVAGLGVAIPALFGYNYLSSQIKNITADMHIFVDEFVTRVAEDYSN